MHIAITTSSFGKFDDAPLAMLRKAGVTYTMNPYGRALTEDEALELFHDCQGVAAGTEPLTRRVLEANPQLKAISRCGAGTDSVDKAAAAELGIAVLCTPDAPTRAAAEHTMALMFSMLRMVPRMDAELRASVWKKRMGNLMFGKKVGIVGFGRIGRMVGSFLAPFGVEIACHDPFLKDANCPNLSLPELMGWADIVTMHCSKPADGKAVIDAAELALMREGGWIVNASRGGVVDESALLDALESGRLAGAALDVFEKEPYDGPLRGRQDVVLTPHAASYAKEARISMEIDTIANLLRALGLPVAER